MKLRLTAVLVLALISLGQSIRPTPPMEDFEILAARAHLPGCVALEHIGESRCLKYQKALIGMHRAEVRTARRQAIRKAAAVVRQAKSKKAAAEALDRRQAD